MSGLADPVVGREIPIHQAAQRLIESENVCDQRKGRDLHRLSQLSTSGPWSEWFAADCVVPLGRQRTLTLLGRLRTASLVWARRPQPHDDWTLMIAMPPYYPLAMPQLRFVGQVPYNPHVLHRDHLPSEGDVPSELRRFVAQLREGYDGGCCFLDTTQWKATPQFDLALVVWQTSLILTGARIHGERGALNNHARDHYLRLAEQGALPLGPALPAPVLPAFDSEGEAETLADDEIMQWDAEDVQWFQQTGGQQS